MLSLESQFVFQNLLFVLFCYITNHLMTGPLGQRETLRFSGTKIHFSPRDQTLSVKCCHCMSMCTQVWFFWASTSLT